MHKAELENNWVAEAARKRGVDCPEFLANKPELKYDLYFFWIAFWDLTTCRSYGGMAEGPIPWTTAIFYAEKYGWEDEDGFWRVISAMDSKYMSIVHKER